MTSRDSTYFSKKPEKQEKSEKFERQDHVVPRNENIEENNSVYIDKEKVINKIKQIIYSLIMFHLFFLKDYQQ